MRALKVLAAAGALFVAASGAAHAQILDSEEEVDATLASFMTNVVERKVEPAFREIQRYTPFSEAEFNALVQKAVPEIAEIEGRLGKPFRFERILMEKASTTSMRQSYAVYYASDAVRWDFLLYLTAEKPQWVLQSIKWMEGNDTLFPEGHLLRRLRH